LRGKESIKAIQILYYPPEIYSARAKKSEEGFGIVLRTKMQLLAVGESHLTTLLLFFRIVKVTIT